MEDIQEIKFVPPGNSASVNLDSGPPAEAGRELYIKYFENPYLASEALQLQSFIWVYQAHVLMLIKQKLIDERDGIEILRGLSEIKEEGITTDNTKNSFTFQIERVLGEKIGEDRAGQLGTALSRIDHSSAGRRATDRAKLLEVMHFTTKLQEVLLNIAGDHHDTFVMNYTHMQQAQPTTLAQVLLSFVSALNDDFKRGKFAFDAVNDSPLGGCGLSGTAFDIDRHYTAKLLGFAEPIENSLRIRNPDYATDIVHYLSRVMDHLTMYASTFHIWSTNEFGYLKWNKTICGSSSIFPQKQNPVLLERIKTEGGKATSWSSAITATWRGEGTGDQFLYGAGALQDQMETTRQMQDLFCGVLNGMIVQKDRMMEVLDKSWCTSTKLADKLAETEGIPFRQAHGIVARLALAFQHLPPKAVQLEQLNSAVGEALAAPLKITQDQLTAALDSQNFIMDLKSFGSPHPTLTKQQREGALVQLENNCHWLEEQKHLIDQALDSTNSAITELLPEPSPAPAPKRVKRQHTANAPTKVTPARAAKSKRH